VDGYMSQWMNTLYKDLSSYNQFMEVITEFCGDQRCKIDGDVLCIKACMIEPRKDPRQHIFSVIQQ
jgi:hypothetical protein